MRRNNPLRNRTLYFFIGLLVILVGGISYFNFYYVEQQASKDQIITNMGMLTREDKLQLQVIQLQKEIEALKSKLNESPPTNDIPQQNTEVETQQSKPEEIKPLSRDEADKIEQQRRQTFSKRRVGNQDSWKVTFNKQLEEFKLKVASNSNKNCIQTRDRDYKQQPVSSEYRGNDPNIQCPIPCVHGSDDISNSRRDCPHIKSYQFTMENRGASHGDFTHIAGNTKLTSDVVMQYFSWAEYDFMKPVPKKIASAPLAAFISNCGPQYRLNYLKSLMTNGIKVDSFGKCMNNMQESRKSNDNHSNKVNIAEQYKFIFAFENSETEDYVTEKLFQPLVSGSIPIYRGAPLPAVKKFAPSNHSVIWADEFEPEELAELINKIDKDDNLFNEYMKWKTDGPNEEWITLIDLSILHSECRFCIRSADIDRVVIGEVKTGPFESENMIEMSNYVDKPDALMLKVRERGEFWMRRIHLETFTVDELRRKIIEKWNDPSKGKLMQVYELWDREKTPITTKEQIMKLDYGDEIEVTFLNPNSPDRHGYSKWWQDKQTNY